MFIKNSTLQLQIKMLLMKNTKKFDTQHRIVFKENDWKMLKTFRVIVSTLKKNHVLRKTRCKFETEKYKKYFFSSL